MGMCYSHALRNRKKPRLVITTLETSVVSGFGDPPSSVVAA